MVESPKQFSAIHQFDFEQHKPGIYINFKALILRTITICLGSFYVGFTIVYYYTMTSWYCAALNDMAGCLSRNYFLVGSIIPLAAIVSSLLICPILQRFFSRRHILMIGGVLGVTGGILMIICYTTTRNLFDTYLNPLFLIGRIFHGFSVGLFMTFCLVTINEFSPVELKMGMIGTYQISIQLGIILTNSTFLILAKLLFNQSSQSWRYINSIMFALSMITLIVQFFLLLFVYKEDTPIYLINKQRYEQAKEVISSIYHKDFVNQKFLELKAEINLDMTEINQDYGRKSIFWKGLFLGVYAIFSQQMSGINFINTFGLHTDSNNLYSSLYIFLQILPQLCQLLGTIMLLVVNRVDRLRQMLGRSKRKTLIRIGTIGCCVLMFVTLVLQSIKQNPILEDQTVLLVLECLFMLIFGFTLGPVVCLYISQMLSCFQIQLVIALHWILAFLNMYGFALIQSNSSTRWVVPFILFFICLVLAVLHKWYLIETKNQSKLQIYRSIDMFRFKFCKKEQ